MTNARTSILRAIQDLDEPLIKKEPCRTLADARVLWADYDLIQRDFAATDFTATLPDGVNTHDAEVLSESERPDIDRWLLSYSAVISETQLQYTNTNEAIRVFGPPRVGYRPPRYGRALVVQLTDTWPNCAYLDPDRRPQGLLDVKGCGVAVGQVPLVQLYRTGLLGLPAAFCELTVQHILERIFEHLAVVDVGGVGIYAILDLGFRIKGNSGILIPAGAVIRRAHQRPAANIERPDYGTEQHRIKLAIEFILRHFGVTSCTPDMQFRIWREGDRLRSLFRGALDKIPTAALERFLMRASLQAPVTFDLINVQLVRGASLAPFSATLVDFGQYDFNDKRFVNPLGCLVENRPLNWGGFIDANSRYWVQPNPQISIDGELGRMIPTPSWIFEWAGKTAPAKTTGLFAFAAELARDMTRGNAPRSELEKRIATFVASATNKLDQRLDIAGSNNGHWPGALPNPEAVEAATPAAVLDALARAEGFLALNRLRWLDWKASGVDRGRSLPAM
jgi:hypothetical protein